MKNQTGIRIILGLLVLTLLTIFFFSVYTYYANARIRTSNKLVIHTNKVLYESEKVISILKDIETGTRGFVLTGDSLFLQPYLIAKSNIASNLAELNRLTVDNKTQQSRIKVLTALTAERMEVCQKVQDIRQRKDYVLENVKPFLLRGRSIMDSIRENISSIQKEEAQLLAVREQQNKENQSKTERSFFVLFGSIIFLFITAYFANRHFAKLRHNNSNALIKSDSNLIFFSKRIDEIVKGISDPFFALDKNYVFTFHNEAVQNTIGLGKPPLMGKNIFEVFSQYRDNIMGRKIREVMETRKSASFEAYEDFLDQWQDINIYPTSEGVSVYIKDATMRRSHEKELNDVRELLESTNQVALIGGWEVDLQSGKINWTSVTRLIHETDDDYVPTLTTGILFYKEGESRDTISQLVKEAIEEGRDWDAELQITTAKGNEKWIRTKGKPEFHHGECVRLIGTFQDIDAQKKVSLELLESEQKLAEERNMFLTVINNLPVNIYMKDLESRKTLINKSELLFSGLKNEDEVLGKSDFDLYPKDMAQISRDEDLQVFRTGKPILDKETRLVKHNGVETFFLSSKIPYYDKDGKIVGLIGISYDITHRKLYEKIYNSITS